MCKRWQAGPAAKPRAAARYPELRGRQPLGCWDGRFEPVWIFVALVPATRAGVALALPKATTAAMNLFLAEPAIRLSRG